MTRLGILASGRGSNFIAIHDAIKKDNINAEIVLLISNNPDSKAIQSAGERKIKTILIPSKAVTRDNFDAEVVKTLLDHSIDLVVLAGFMRIIGKAFTEAFPCRIMNVHPSLLPSFKGLDAQKQAIEYGAKVSGCTVHFVDDGVDTGPIILQTAVPVYEDDSEETLSDRILKEEHRIYPEAVRLYSEGRLKVLGPKVIIS